ncbi:MAG: hypothetical protein RL685_6045 [Pseudomonadota bacterium]
MRGEDILNVLLDVEWVVGSFVADSAGQLLLYQMPAEFGEAELKRTTVRLASILRCAELCELGVEQCALSLNRYQLLMSRFRNGFLCVMVEAPVNRRALEMATRIAVESLPSLVDALDGNAPASGQTQAHRALAQALERDGQAPSSATEPDTQPLLEPERGSEPAATELARVLGNVAGSGLGSGAPERRDRDEDPVG